MSDGLAPLSDREMEIVQLLATGATNQQIAHELVISINTVKVHLRNIYAKLEVASRTEATMVAVRKGWVGVPQQDQAQPSIDQDPAELAVFSLPSPEQVPVSLVKRIGLVIATLVAVALLFLPLVLQGQSNGEENGPFPGFPTEDPDPSPYRWRTQAQMPTPRNGLAVAEHQNLIFAIGGVSNEGVTGKVEVYDPRADVWASRSSKPTAVGFASAAVVDGKIFVPGGVGVELETHNVLEIYDPVKDAWQEGTPMPVPLSAYGLAAFDGQLYLFGGFDGQEYVASVFRYDPQTDQWQELDPMAKPRGFLGAAVLGDRIFVVGGFDDVSEFDDSDAYDPRTGDWTSRQPMDQQRGGLTVVAVRDRLYAIGGGMDSYLAFNEQYDPLTDAWTRIATPVTDQWRGLGAAFANPNVYAIGGWSEGNLSVNEAYQALFQIQIPIRP